MRSLIQFKNGSTLKVDGSPAEAWSTIWRGSAMSEHPLATLGELVVNYGEILYIQPINEGD